MALRQIIGSPKPEDDADAVSDKSDSDSVHSLTEKESETRFIAWYSEVCNERLAMLEAEEIHKKRIQNLEEGLSDLLESFDEANKEIKFLRNKYEPDKHSTLYTESYETVFKEREQLRAIQRENKERIKNLEFENASERMPRSVMEVESTSSRDTGLSSLDRSSSISLEMPSSLSSAYTEKPTPQRPKAQRTSNIPRPTRHSKDVIVTQSIKLEKNDTMEYSDDSHKTNKKIAVYTRKNIVPYKKELEKRLNKLKDENGNKYVSERNTSINVTGNENTKNTDFVKQKQHCNTKSFRDYVNAYTAKRHSYLQHARVNHKGLFSIVSTAQLKRLEEENKRLLKQVDELEYEKKSLAAEMDGLKSDHQRLKQMKSFSSSVIAHKRFGRTLRLS